MKNSIVFLILCFVFSTSSVAQNYKYGKVSKEELEEKNYTLDSKANAVVLYENKKVYFEYIKDKGFYLITEFHKRIKLYNQKGFDAANHEVYLYKQNSDEEKISGLNGKTYNLINGEIEEVKLKKEGVFNSEYSEYYYQTRFTMPALQEGAVVEYKYKITSPFTFNMDRIYLQYNIPIKKQDIEVNVPEYFNFKKMTTGFLPVNIKESSRRDNIVFNTKTRSEGSYTTETSYSSSKIEFSVNKYQIIASNIPAFIDEPFLGNSKNYISSINYELQFINYPNSPIKHYATTWEDVAKKIYSRSSFGAELDKKNYFKEDVDQLLSGVNNPMEKVKKIYDFVKKKMTWNKSKSLYTRDGVKKAYKQGTGNSAEINLMLTAMLTYANINANPILVSTSDRVINLFPTVDGFNYVICRVSLSNSDILYLDATDKYGEFNILPNRVLQGSARVIAENGTSEYVNLRPKKPSAKKINVQYEIDNQGSVNGKISLYNTDYLAHNFRVKHAVKDQETQIKRLKELYEINDITGYTLGGVEDLSKAVNERFEFKADDQVEVIDNEMFFSPLLFLRDKENVFKSEERKYPIDFGFGFSNLYRFNIKIPEGYEIVEFPQSGVLKLPDNIGSFSFQLKVAGSMIQVVVNETITPSVITEDYYTVLKEFYNKVIEKESEQVVLKKI